MDKHSSLIFSAVIDEAKSFKTPSLPKVKFDKYFPHFFTFSDKILFSLLLHPVRQTGVSFTKLPTNYLRPLFGQGCVTVNIMCHIHNILFPSKLMNGPSELVLHHTRLERLARDKHSSLLGPYVSFIENEEL